MKKKIIIITTICFMVLFSFIALAIQFAYIPQPGSQTTSNNVRAQTIEKANINSRNKELTIFKEKQSLELKDKYNNHKKYIASEMNTADLRNLKKELKKTNNCLTMVTIDGEINIIPDINANKNTCFDDDTIDHLEFNEIPGVVR